MICKSRSGTRKLLAVSAVLAMAFCVFAAAVPADAADGTEVPTYTMYDNKSVIKWTAANGTTTDKTLKEAMEILQNGSITSGTMTFPAGNFDVAWGDETIMGSAFVINATNVTINGEKDKTLIYCGEVTKGKAWAVSVEIADTKIKTCAQNAVTVYNSVTMNNLTVMNNIYESWWYKSICVDNGEVTLDNCTLMPNSKIEGIDYSKIVGNQKGGVLIITGNSSLTVENSKLYDGVINTAWAEKNGKMIIKNTELIVTGATGAGINNVRTENGKEIFGPPTSAENVTIRIASGEAYLDGIISKAVPGVTISIETDITLASSVSLKEGVDIDINKGHSLSIPSDVELNISEGSDVNIDGTLNVYGKLASSGTISGNGTVFADQDSVIPSDLADDITVTHPFVPMPDEDDEFPGYVPSQPSSDDSSDDDSTTQVAIVAAAIAVVLIAIIALLYKSR